MDNLASIHDQILARFGDHAYINLSWVVFEDYILLRNEERDLRKATN